jgi:hypothetical protein
MRHACCVAAPCRNQSGKFLVDEFRAKYPGWAQPARVQAGVAAVYRELP